MTQIYKKETLIELYGEEKGIERSKQTYREVILQLGKGSGKDYTSTIACAYIVYQLLCLKDPAGYYGKPAGDAIDILNIAINATQAKNVFFKGFRERIKRSPWFQGKYDSTQESMKFDKGITVHSGHSEREAWEGYNTLVVILDEISGFAVENNTGHTQSKTAEDIYKMYNGSLSSRFPDYGKLLLLSFPRYKNDFIQKRYDEVVAQKEVVMRSADLIVNPDLPEDFAGNTINVEWEEDHIISYREARVFALKRPTWEVNPTRQLQEYTQDFYKDMQDALSRFACMPPDSIDAFFKSRTKIQHLTKLTGLSQKMELLLIGLSRLTTSNTLSTLTLPRRLTDAHCHLPMLKSGYWYLLVLTTRSTSLKLLWMPLDGGLHHLPRPSTLPKFVSLSLTYSGSDSISRWSHLTDGTLRV